MKFKKGQKVICIEKPPPGCYQFYDDNPIGKIYIVDGTSFSNIALVNERGFFNQKHFVFAIKTEIEYLDAIQENFSKGF